MLLMTNLLNMNLGQYTWDEHSVYVGKIPKYRRRIKEGATREEASNECAKDIIAGGDCGPGGILEKRYTKTQKPFESFGQHIRRMDEVVAGIIDENDLHISEQPWYKRSPYKYENR